MPRISPKDLSALKKARARLGKDTPIVTGKTGLITRSNIARVIRRWSERKGRTVLSFDNLIRDHKEPKRFHNTSASEVTRRLAQKELLKSIRHIPLAPRQRKIVQELLDHRNQKISGTNIELRPGHSLLLVELNNSLGEKKTMKILKTLTKRAKAIKRLNLLKKNDNIISSDIFQNIPQAVAISELVFEMDLQNKSGLASSLDEFIEQKRGDIHQLTKSNLSNKDRHIKTLRNQLKTAMMERVKFKMKHDLPL